MSTAKVGVVFVCLGNICRSPTAESLFIRAVAEAGVAGEFDIDSAGTGAWHVGQPADARSRAEAKRRGVEIRSIARKFIAEDLDRFDHVVVMDRANQRDVLALATRPEHRAKVSLFRAYDPESAADEDVPDPYDGGPEGFRRVFDLCDAAARGLLAELQRTPS